MDDATILAAWGDDEVMILLKHILSLLEQANLLSSGILLGNGGEFLSLADLQQAIDRCDERLAAHNPDHPLYSTARESLDTLAGVVGFLSLLAPRIHSQAEQQKDTSDSQILVEKSETDVDNIQAPLGSRFNVENSFGRGPMGGMRNPIGGLREEAYNMESDILYTAEITKHTEVENEADVNRKKPGTQHTAPSQGNLLAVGSELQHTRRAMIATKGVEHSPGFKIVGCLMNSRTGLTSSETQKQAQDSTDVVGESIPPTTDVRVAEIGMPGSSSPIETDLSHTSPLRQPTYWESGSPINRLKPTMVGDLLEALVTDNIHQVAVFDHLSVLSSLKYKETGAMSDLRKAIMHGEKALAAMPQDHDDRATCLNNLAANLHLEYKRTGAIKDLQQAITNSEEALAAVPQGHSERAGFLNNLAIVLGAMHREEGAPDHLQKAIWCSERALAECHRHRAPILDNLAAQLVSRYKSERDVGDLKQAIIYAEEALAATSQDHPHRAYRLSNLAASLHHRSLLPSSCAKITDLSNAILFYKEASSCNMSPPYMRVLAARLCVNLSCELQSRKLPRQVLAPGSEETSVPSVTSDSIHDNAVLRENAALLESAVLLLPQVSPRPFELQYQQYRLKMLNGIAEEAASISLHVGKTGYHALKLLELSRGIIQGFAIDCRNDLSDLKKTNIGLFNKFNDIREEIDNPGPEYQLFSRAYALERRETAIREMEKTIVEIRELPGHKEFQRPPSPEALMSMAKDGPIVVVISSVFGSHAIIVTSSTITTIELPKLIFDEIPERLRKIAKLAKSPSLKKYLDNNKQMLNILSWLWDVAVQPVIQSLQLTTTTEDADRTLIWWIGVGEMSVAPFHAAGYYSQESNPSQRISSYAISSYTPTIKALSYARERDFTRSNGASTDDRILLVAMQETPGYQDLPNAVEEVARIMSVAEISANMEYLDQPSAEDILDRLQSCQIIHFACHGIPDEDPSHSHLVLFKDGKADKLMVQAVSSKNGKAARLAYLSACCTATARDVELADESIHIASGFQLAGFSHVLATMWEANSKVCADVSTEFYRSLFNSGGVGGHREVAMAFHRAVKKVRVNNLQQPLKWAPFIHVGA